MRIKNGKIHFKIFLLGENADTGKTVLGLVKPWSRKPFAEGVEVVQEWDGSDLYLESGDGFSYDKPVVTEDCYGDPVGVSADQQELPKTIGDLIREQVGFNKHAAEIPDVESTIQSIDEMEQRLDNADFVEAEDSMMHEAFGEMSEEFAELPDEVFDGADPDFTVDDFNVTQQEGEDGDTQKTG
jgi:superfamily I DNA and RNA helicase